MHPGSPTEPVLAAGGITTGGKPAFIGLAPGSGESADAWHDLNAGKQVHSFLATSGPVMRASSGKVAAMMPRDTRIPPAVMR